MPRSARPAVTASSTRRENSTSEVQNEYSATLPRPITRQTLAPTRTRSKQPIAKAGSCHQESELPSAVRKNRSKYNGPTTRSAGRPAVGGGGVWESREERKHSATPRRLQAPARIHFVRLPGRPTSNCTNPTGHTKRPCAEESDASVAPARAAAKGSPREVFRPRTLRK